MSHAANVMKYNCQFGEGPRGLKASWNYMSEMSKSDTALPPTPYVALFFFSFLIGEHAKSNMESNESGPRSGQK